MLQMTVPFTQAEFFALFSVYNAALWPFALALWVATAAALLLVLRAKPIASPVFALLAVHWAWAGIAYHLVLFTRVNPAAWIFGALFVIQALLLARAAMTGSRLRYGPVGTPARIAGISLVVYALAYPLLAAAGVHSWPGAPSFGVPCPTALLTAGFLLMAAPVRRALLVIPLLWSIIGGSAALLLGVWADLALFAAALALLVALSAPRLVARPGVDAGAG